MKHKSVSEQRADGMTRRNFLRVGALTAVGLSLADRLALSAFGEPAEAFPAKARSVIQIWLAGGPSHIDMFDPKPDAGEAYCGPLNRPIQTNVPGIMIGQLLPLLARQADKYSLIRSMTHGNDGHETAAYIMMTGTMPSADLSYPSMGSVVALKRGYEAGYKGPLPPYIMLTQPLGRFSETGFLGMQYKSFATGGDPQSADFRVGGIVLPGRISEQRFQERQALLKSLDSLATNADPQVAKTNTLEDAALGLIAGDARKAFDLSQEKTELREKYGRNTFGQSCLLARRMVENGVPFITINNGGWDTHKDHFPIMQKKLPVIDQGLATLLEDLAERGLLESTIVTCYGEFGRTPKVLLDPPWNGGRGHYGTCFSALVAGGGFQGGKIVGASDSHGEKVRDRPVYPWDLSASIYKLLGIDPHGRLPHPQGCVAYVSPLASGTVPTGGILKEIM